MDQYKGTIIHEPCDKETINFTPSYRDGEIISQSVSIAPISNNDVSLIVSKLTKSYHGFVHFIFTDSEVGLLIDALQEAREAEDRIEG